MNTPIRTATTPKIVSVSMTPFCLGLHPTAPVDSPRFLRRAGHAARLLPAIVHDALVDFADEGHQSGALLLRGLPIGELPPTPDRPTAPTAKDMWTEFLLLTVARRMGQPIGYLPEHGGDVVQNIVPTRNNLARQTSTSSKVDLLFHTETAFHPHRPRYLLLLCLRGDSRAKTTLASIRDALPMLSEQTVAILRQPRFRTATDESFRSISVHTNEGTPRPGAPIAALTGTDDSPTLIYDADLMTGIDPDADAALSELTAALQQVHDGIVLEPGDLLVVDNYTAVHGRTSFEPRFDGTDRWLQRSFVVSDLAPSAHERLGRIITTTFS